MRASPIVPCIWLDDQAEQAADIYVRTFPGGRVVATSRYPESSDNPGGRPRGSVLTVEVELAGQRFTLLNGGPMFVPNPSVSFFVHVDDPGAADRIFSALADGDQALMPLGAYPWSGTEPGRARRAR
jgi:predicted 3-demethylubiquinone-9 3-methyltransferase (glyoxalase superfamily)